MAEDLKLIEEPLNFTDAFVVFDPEIEKPKAAKILHSEETDPTVNHESYKTNGFDTPIIVVDQQPIPEELVESMYLNYYEFLPRLEFTINDPKKDIQFIGGPGLHNMVILVLCPNIEGMYRSISMPFYIKTRENLTDDQIKYVCEYHNIGLTDVECMQVGDKPLTTYEFCEKFAKMLKLGFSCTDKCKDISDARWRQMYSQKSSEFIVQQIGLGGLDDSSFFDAWIDTHGYLNLINMSWIFSANVKPENLSIATQPKMDIPIKDAPEGDQYMTQRTLSTMENYPISELKITRHYANLDTADAKQMGTDVSYWCLMSAGDENKLEQTDVKTIEDSLEGKAHPSEYTFRKVEFLGCEMAEDLPYMVQEATRKHWIQKKKTKEIIVHLMKPNFGLERGTLVNVVITDSNAEHMRTISQNFENTVKSNRQDGEPYVVDDSKEPVSTGDAADGNSSILNPATSGIYFIEGMRYFYTKGNGKVEQVLYLIKKSDNDNNLFHSEATPVITTSQGESLTATNSNES